VTLRPGCRSPSQRKTASATYDLLADEPGWAKTAVGAALRSAPVDLELVFLGTAASAPTAARGTASTLIRRGGDRVLVDCGEGTQRQLLRSDVGLVDLEHIFLTHLHADHVLGLPGMLKTFGLRGREVPVTVYGPRGTRALLGALGVVVGRVAYPLEIRDLGPGEVIGRDGYRIETFAVRHGTPAVGYALREDERPGRFDAAAADALGVPDGPERGALQRGEAVTLADGRTIEAADVVGEARRGRVVVLTGDTAPAASVVEAAAGADVLVHEATFLAEERMRARETAHSTAGEAALVAREAQVGVLVLTHLSARYPPGEVADEARQLFPQTVVPRDFDLLSVPFPERGEPELVARGGRRGRAAEDRSTEDVGSRA
jgi:ribonuclease Z